MAVNPSYGSTLSGLARAMVQHGRLPENVAEEVSSQARKSGVPFIEQLIQSHKLTAVDIAEFASHVFGLPPRSDRPETDARAARAAAA
jgi:type IV pilus assembly protein PilB